ncbi:MAG: hypothetical protein HBSAPP02_04890 [Phycisphaerae bacterium]|nr:MAG: hypothetical protein HRU71_11025 [Planctomycetia bacterium]RIK71756.1 MAG: hypothetical protein DCC66_00525 [Planctomycetota bacterium]GJQ25457.1 MAG: hypothetical protein HBSAPP02_04890 [Phycisphaerae bacterium]
MFFNQVFLNAQRGFFPVAELTELSRRDRVVLGCVVVGIIAQIFQKRLPVGLGSSLFVAGVTLGGALVVHDRFAGTQPAMYLALMFASVVCLLCSGMGAATALGERSRRDDARHPPSDAFFIWSLLAGVTAAGLIAYFLAVQTGQRLFSLTRERGLSVPIGGFLALAALLIAVLFWRTSHRRPHQPTMVLVIGALAAWWGAMLFPSVRGGRAESGLVAWLPPWWSWVFQLMAGLAALIIVAAVIQDHRYRRRIASAWPDRLDELVEPYSRWPGYIQTEAMIAAALLIMGVYQLVRREAPSAAVFSGAAVVSLLAGYACLFMTYRRWSANTAGLGMALVTAAIVHGAAAITAKLLPDSLSAQYARRMPVLYNAILMALAVMAACWRWLAGVWDQQLLNGIAWTTTGRMIPYARRTAFFIMAIAALIAFQMAIWPQRIAEVDDKSAGRIVCGLGVLLLCALIAALAARQGGSPALAAMSLVFIAAAALFVFVRLPASSFRGWLVQYDPIVYSVIALPVLGLAELVPATRWRAFAVPMWFLALLLLPAAALAQLLGAPLPEGWVKPLTLAILGAVYGIAGLREHRRAFLVLAGVLIVASITTLPRA